MVKASLANGRNLVKLSNNIEKASGDAPTIERYKRIFGYTNTERAECVV